MDRRCFMRAAAAAPLYSLAPSLVAAGGEGSSEFEARMQWWREARFGMFIHWGIYSVPGGVWKGSRVENFPAEWIMFAKEIPKKEYARLAAEFNPVRFDPAEWARTARNAGMKYLVITSKHHDGFCMYHTARTDYNVVDATPFKRDVIKELARACADEGIRFGLYYSVLDWRFMAYPYYLYVKPRFNRYFKYMCEQVREIFTGYGPLCSLFFDGNWMPQWREAHGRKVESICRELQPKVVINDRLRYHTWKEKLGISGGEGGVRKPAVGDYATPEQFIPSVLPSCDWETCMTMNDSWGYRSWDHNWKPTENLIRNLCDIASKGGNFLLNVGPTSEGIIPEASVERLSQMGDWLSVNGEAIYGTGAGPIQDAVWGRTTRKGDVVYLHVFDWPAGELSVRGTGLAGKKAALLTGSGKQTLPVREGRDGITIKLPEKPVHPAASVIALK